jgi:hypothetical protein
LTALGEHSCGRLVPAADLTFFTGATL